MTDENLQDGGLGAAKAVAEAGFSDELRRQLEERMLNSKFKSENHAAFAQLDMPVCLCHLEATMLTLLRAAQAKGLDK